MDELLIKLTDGQVHSGEALCGALGMTRAAVWKRVERLRAEGYAVEAVPRRGYRLIAPPDSLLPGYVRMGLRTRWAGRGELYYAPECDSTNAVLKRAALAGEPPAGSLAWCERQTAGRGRMKRAWEAEGGALLHSVLLRPALPAEQAQLCTLAAAIAAAKAIEAQGLQPRIKWPNDVVLNGRKCVGILSELSADPDGVRHVVVGVGINVNQRAFPEALRERATSLWLERGDRSAPDLDRRRLLCDELSALEGAMDALESGGLAALLPEYLPRSATLGRRVEVTGAAERYVGTADGLDERGALLVTDDAGARHTVLSADVSVRGLMGYV